MSAHYHRRRDLQPMGQGWEAPTAAIGGVLFGVVFAALAGLAVASACFGGGWVWPHGHGAIQHTLGGLLQGRPGRGLTRSQREMVPGHAVVYGCVIAAELLLITLAITVGVLISRYRRPGDARGGMATRAEAQRVLGISRLRSAKELIRPDRYMRARRHPSKPGTP